jgi:hypothetical protein
MAKRNTTKSKKPIEEAVEAEAPVEEVELVDEPAETIEEAEFTEPEVPQEPKTIGIVTGCRLLNIRRRPDLEAEILCFVRCESEITIDTSESSTEWLKVRNSDGIEGYCMARYVYIKQ